MFAIQFDTNPLGRRLDRFEQRELKFALVLALNQTAFETREAWSRLAASRFDRPTPLTTGAVLYTKATKANIKGAEVFLRDRVAHGAPPSKYLRAEEFGGLRAQKAFEKRLARLPGGRQYYTPGQNAPLDAYGNIAPSFLRKVISALGSTGGEQPDAKGAKKKRRRTSGFFLLRRPVGKLVVGAIYQRGAKGRGRGRVEGLKGILFPVAHAPRYRPRFGAIKEAHRIFNAQFEKNFRAHLKRLSDQARGS
jgi:hypothetical protein